jgi:hypothetical protein
MTDHQDQEIDSCSLWFAASAYKAPRSSAEAAADDKYQRRRDQELFDGAYAYQAILLTIYRPIRTDHRRLEFRN